MCYYHFQDESLLELSPHTVFRNEARVRQHFICLLPADKIKPNDPVTPVDKYIWKGSC